ncbi:MAG: Calx-beta domain-containing protein [Limnoraphis robusta]
MTIAAGATTATLEVIPVFDNISETDEKIEVSLQPGNGYALTTLNTASLIIGDRSLIVTNTNDSGVGSLRQVITTANQVAGTDIITFNIPQTDPGFNPNTGTFSIRPVSPLPSVTDAAILDATSQPGYTNTPLIEIDGSNISDLVSGLTITAGNSTVKGFVINRFAEGIRLITAGNNTIQGNYIGTDVTGNIDLGNTVDGIFLGGGTSGNLIGGTTPQTRNLISGNGRNGVQMDTSGDNIIQGNFIGTNISGTADLGNSGAGIGIFQEENNQVGGSLSGAGNLISGNDTNGIELNGFAAINNLIQGNWIGTTSNGNTPLGNSQSGILVLNNANNNTIGGIEAGNIIAFNNGDGVTVESGEGNAILSNSIFDNGLSFADIGIDLNNDGTSINDFGDADTGANTLQNYPDLLTATLEEESIQIQGILDSTPGSTFTIQFFANELLGASDRQGRTFLGETLATSNIPFTVSFDVELLADQRSITATATDINNNTSEFSTPITANTAPILDLDEDDSSGMTGNNYSTRFTEGRNPVAVADTDVEIEDADSENLASATVILTNPLNGQAESLAVNGELPAGIRATAYNSVSGQLQLQGTASLVDYQTAISQIVYNNSILNPDLSDRIINISVNDGTSNSNIAETTISLVGTVQVSIAANTSPTEGEIGSFTVTLDEPINQPLIVEFDLNQSSAVNPEDYTLEAGTGITSITQNTFTIEAGVTTATLNVVTVDDDIFDPEETVQINLVEGSNYLLTDNNSDVITITDNDTVGILLTPPVEAITSEDEDSINYQFVLFSQPTADVIINLENTNPSEGSLSAETITFTPENWNTPQTVTVNGVDDNIVDGDVNYIITPTVSSLDENYNNFQLEDITLTNQDNDVVGITLTPPVEAITSEDEDSINYQFVLFSQPIADVIINLENTNPDEGSLSTETITFTSENWNIPQTVTVTGVDDNIVDGDLDYNIVTTVNSEDDNYNNFQLEDITLTNEDNDVIGIERIFPPQLITTENGDSIDFELVLFSQPIADVLVNLNSSNSNEGVVSPETITFTPENWNIPQTFTVTGVDDNIVDGDLEYTVTSNVISQDNNYNGFQLADITLTNLDNDVVGITLIPPVEAITTEDGDSVNYEFILNSQPTADVIINLENTNADEGSLSAETLTFTPENWNNSQIFTVTGVDDDIVDGNINYSITPTVSSNDLTYNNFNLPDINFTNLDNDQVGIVVTPINGLTTTEAGDIATFEIFLTSQPTAEVSFNLNSSNPNEGSLSISEVIFTPENWNISQIVIVTGVDDDIADGDLSYSIITDTAVSNDPNYNNINPEDVNLVNADNETPGITITPVNGLLTTEAGGSDSFEIFLNTEPVDDITIRISSSDITEGIVSTNAVTFTPDNWNIPQMVMVTGVDDNIDDDDILYTIITTPDITTTDPNYNRLNPADISVTNTDNDTAEIVVTPTSGLVTSEAGGSATFDVFLTSEPTANVILNLISSNTAEGILSRETLTFTPQNWQLTQRVTVTGVDDLIADGDINYSIITANAISSDGKYNGFNPEDIAVVNTDNETPGISISPTSGLVTNEAGETATFQVVLNTQPLDNVTLNLISDNSLEGVVFPPSLTFTPDNWLTPQIVTVTGVDDSLVDGDIEYRIITESAISNDPNYNNRNPENITVTNLDNDLPIVDLSVDLTTGEEANTTAITVTVSASANVDGEQTVNLDVSGIGITSNDYTLSNFQLTIPDGNNTASVTFQVLDDIVFEGNETALLTLSNPSEGILLGTATTNITIIDNDTPPTVEFSQTDYQINEDGTIVGAEITINRTGDISKASTVDVELTEGTATAGEYFDENLISVRFAANQRTATVDIPIIDDDLVEEDETFFLELVNPSVGTEIGSQNTATVEIIDNEVARIDISQTELSVTESGITDNYSLVLTTIPTEPVNIRFQTDNQIEPITTITFDETNWSIPQTIEIQAIDDNLVEDRTHNSLITHVVTSEDQNYNGFILDDVNIEIAENDIVDVSIAPTNLTVSEEGETDSYSLVLTRQPELPVTIQFETNEQINPINPITFNSNNWNIPQTVTVEAIDDLIPEGDETIAISHEIVSEDENYRDLQVRTVNVEVLDNDVDAEIFVINTRNLTLTEGEATASYEIVLSSPPVLPVTIEFNTSDRLNSILAIEFDETNWNIPQIVTVVTTDDNIVQGNTTEIIRHTVRSSDRNFDGLEVANVNVNLSDNDVAEVLITQTSNRTEVSEDGLTDTYRVVLNSQPTADVTVTITPDSQVDLGRGAETEINLIFTPQNWNEPQTVTVAAIDDDDVEADIHTSTINHAISSNDSNYNRNTPIRIDGVRGENLTVDIIENDEPLPPGEPGISLIQPVRRTDVIEGFGNDVYKIVLNSEPTANVEININPNSQLQTDKQTLTFTPFNWNISQTLTVTAVDDTLVEGSHIGTISHTVNSEDSRYDNLGIDQLSLNISDNDNIGQQQTFSEPVVISLSELDDTGVGSDFDDILFGNQGNDRLSGEGGFDLVYGQSGADALSGEVGDDVLFGGQGDDKMQGDAGNDIIYGDRGSDRLWGGEGNDQLFGDFGNDRLMGDLGADTLTGGLGNDAFVIGFGTGGNTVETADVIVDFTDTQDVIELISPLTFQQLNITSSSTGTVIQVQSTGEFLAVLLGVNPSQISEQDFV